MVSLVGSSARKFNHEVQAHGASATLRKSSKESAPGNDAVAAKSASKPGTGDVRNAHGRHH